MAIACLALVAVRPARAQGWQFGPQVNFADKHFGLGIGARVVVDLERVASAKNIGLIGSVDYFFPDVNGNPLEINVDGVYRIAIPNAKIFPYVGGGLGFTHWGAYSFNKAHLNLVGGTAFRPLGKIQPFAELRLKMRSGGGQFVITGGVLF
jgi:hypothetical protein